MKYNSCMRIVKQITNNKFLNIKSVEDTDMGCRGYQFAERKGVNSIAFLCYDKETGMFLINREATPSLGVFLYRAFGGAIDKNKSYEGIVLDEVKEEAGYKVNPSKIKKVGRNFVSTQMNQFCYLYLVFVNEKQKIEREPENACEALAEPTWWTEAQIKSGEDWKGIVIIEKAKGLGLI